MVEMKSASAPGCHAAAPEQGVRSMDELLDRTEEREHRKCRASEDADGVDQLAQAVREILPLPPLLELRPVAAPAAAGAGKSGNPGRRTASQPASLAGPREPAVESGPQQMPAASRVVNNRTGPAGGAVIPIARPPEDVPQPNAGQSSASAGIDVGGPAPPASSPSSVAAAGTAEADAAERKRHGGGEDALPPATPPTSESGRQAHAVGPADRAASAPRPRADLAAPPSEQGWVYSFRSWGAQHAVRVSPAAYPGQRQSLSAPLALHPTSALVEQRLSAHGEAAGVSGQWLLRGQDESGRQGQDALRQQQEEDDS